jgi:MYXO-CTERM domain-containing protein
MVFTAAATAHAGDLSPAPQGIVNGSTTETCGWPTTLATNGCTATLVHPKAISTAQHCGQPSSVHFGPTANGAGQDVAVLSCVGTGSEDAQICELAQEVSGVPVTPITFGCELDELVTVGAEVVIAGFGITAYGAGDFGTKRWVAQTITAVEPARVIIGNAGEPTSPCQGDSGGPVFVQGEDGGWRVIGTLLSGTTSTPCNSAAQYMRLDTVVANFEAQTGVDITPCFDGQTGAWEPGPNCGGFFSGDHTGQGSWSDWCAGTPASGPSEACGMGTGEEGGGEGESGGEESESGGEESESGGGEGEGAGEVGSDGGDLDTGGVGTETSAGASDDGNSASGCACSAASASRGRPATAWLVLALLGFSRRRRRRLR